MIRSLSLLQPQNVSPQVLSSTSERGRVLFNWSQRRMRREFLPQELFHHPELDRLPVRSQTQGSARLFPPLRQWACTDTLPFVRAQRLGYVEPTCSTEG